MNLGLEALPMPAGVAPPGASLSPAGSMGSGVRPSSSNDPNKTFDAILAGSDLGKKEKDKKKKK
jgi:hypothetical protein